MKPQLVRARPTKTDETTDKLQVKRTKTDEKTEKLRVKQTDTDRVEVSYFVSARKVASLMVFFVCPFVSTFLLRDVVI